MPPEPVPWDRKDLAFKDRKHDRIAASGDAVATATATSFSPRWRDPYHFSRSSPRRPPQGYHRQNGSYSQLYEDSNGHGCTPSRSDDGFRPVNGRYSGGRTGGRSFRRSPYYDGHETSHVTGPRSVAVPVSSPPPAPPAQDKNGGGGSDDQRSDRDLDRDKDRDKDSSLGSIGWKSLKWSRQSSISLISSSKTVKSEVDEAGNGSLEVSVANLGKETPVRSPGCESAPLDGEAPRKKPRLTWGQGLAKYEKQKVEGSTSSGKDQTSESSPKVTRMAGSMSPLTPCSAPCSSPGMEDRPFSKEANADNNTTHHSHASALAPQDCSEEFNKLDEVPSLSSLTSLLSDLLQSEDAYTGDSTFTRNTCANKLLLLKANISKELEKTECEIDSLENEHKSLNNDGKSNPSEASEAIQVGMPSPSYLEAPDVSPKASNSTSIISSSITAVEEPATPILSSGKHELEVANAHNDIPLTASDNGESIPSSDKEPISLDLRERAVTENVSGDINKLYTGSGSSLSDLDVNLYEKSNNNLIALIMASNREAAMKASQVFDGALPTGAQQHDIWDSDRILSCRKNDMHIREKLTLHKHQLQFKERVLALKFRAFHHLWKEDLRLLSVKKQRPKSQKRAEICSRSSQSSSQKHRSSFRSRCTLPAGNLTLVPTTDIVDFTSRMLSDSQLKLYRKHLKMPALILDEKEKRCSRFITNNNLVEDPLSFEKEKSMINPWSQEEKGVFMDMLATYGKDFAKISSFLSHKTTADCIEFYYKNHKSECFRDVKKQLDLRKQWRSTNTYMVTSGKKWNREANAASLDMLGAVSAAVSHSNGNPRNQQKYPGRSVVPCYHSLKVSRSPSERASSIELSGFEKETAGTDVQASGYCAVSSEAMSSCVTASVSPSEKMNYVRTDRPLTPEVSQTIEEEDTCSDEGCGELVSVDWTDEDKSMFIRALSMYGKDFVKISHFVGTKSRDQCKIFFSKARKCLSLDQIHPVAPNGGTPISDVNGGRSDTDDACAVEMDSAICSTQSCSRMDINLTEPVRKADGDRCMLSGNISPQVEGDELNEQCEAGGTDQEEIDGKVDGLGTDLKSAKCETERENLPSESGKGIADAMSKDSKHCEIIPSYDGSDSMVDREVGKVVTRICASPYQPVAAACTEVENLPLQSNADFQQRVVTEENSAASGLRNGVELQLDPRVSQTRVGEGQPKQIDADKGTAIKSSIAAESSVKETDSLAVTKMNAFPNQTFSFSAHGRTTPLALPSCTQNNSQLSSKQERLYSVPLTTVLPDPSSACSEGYFRVPSQSKLNFNDHLLKLHQSSGTKDFYQQGLSQINLNQIDQSSHVLSGYPVKALNQNDSKREATLMNEKPILHGSNSTGTMNSQLKRYFVPDINSEKGEGSGSLNSRPETFFFRRNEDTSDSLLRPCSSNASQETAEQSATHRTGDVKLFGQILSNPNTMQKSNSSSQETESRPLSPRQKKPAVMTVPINRHDSSSSVFSSRSENIGQSTLEEVPLRSYGYWDGNRIQTGFSSLPDPAIMLAAYQGPVSGTPFLPPKESGVSSANGVATSFQHTYVQPLSANGKRLESFPDLQKPNGFERVSGFQQGGRTAMARLGVNMAGGSRGILVGGTGVSDPVAALKMAKIYTGVESWSRDLNGR